MAENEALSLREIASVDQTEEDSVSSLTTDVTISKDNTDIFAEPALLAVKRAGLDLEVETRQGDEGEDGTLQGPGTQDDQHEHDQSAEPLADPIREDAETQHEQVEDYDVGDDEEIGNAVGQAISDEAVSKSADVLHAQIREKLASIPGLDLPANNPGNQLIEYLTLSVARLSAENRMLKEALQSAKGARPPHAPPGPIINHYDDSDQPEAPAFEEVHLVWCVGRKTYFRDVPRMFKGDSKSDHLRGCHSLENMETYLKKRKHLAFVIIHHYQCWCAGGTDYHRLVGFKGGRLLDDSQPAEALKKHLFFNDHVKTALLDIAKAHPGPFSGWDMANIPRWSYEPHFMFYVHHKTFLDLADSSNLSTFEAQSVRLLCSWVLDNYKEDWDEANALFERGKVTAKHFNKLFRPGELFVLRERDRPETTWVFKVISYPWSPEPENSLRCYRWSFNGLFSKVRATLALSFMTSQSGSELGPQNGEVDITSIASYPLRFSDHGVYNALLARGNRFWQCRRKKIVSYNDPDLDDEDGVSKRADHRFMVDYTIFKRMHPRNTIFSTQADDLGSKAMSNKEPPDDDFLALLPPDIHAFDFSSKTWKLIKVEGITDVTWNKDAFKRLVLPKENKELMQAAVMAQGHLLSASPDIIAGKGQGLLILLHGGPGTGKTVTAESIAETQERPLYRVTCGDIGIEPTQVEQYLETVFTIGKAWGCVVLLDEADVFLEERTVTDQKQNAVVSVFLRLLEYYDGILVLTTNRVGTFDEAFKSRIHLALRYENLNQEQRVEIWRNLIDMLKDFTMERVDTGDLLMNVNKLAREELNGRQIRNVITLARYLAKFRGEILVYKHVQDALASVVKFDQYLLGLRGSDDHFATEQKLR